MPLFMDYHKGLSVSVEDVKKAHIADEAVQSKYGVIYHQFWVNEEDGTVFCLMEGPDKESCAAVHREAHGGVACSIVEVSTGFYKLFMGNGHVVEQGHVRRSDGTADPGMRTILVINIQGRTNIKRSADYRSLRNSAAAKELTISYVSRFHGREVNWLHDDSLVAVFDASLQAVNCALELQSELAKRANNQANDEWNITFKIGLSSGQPLTESGDLFANTIMTARRLCNIASANEVLVSPRILESCNVKELSNGRKFVRILSTREQDFITSLFSISEKKLSDELFTVDTLCRHIGVSRPQLYRKIVSLTGKSPHDFIRDLRMDKALALLKQRAGNVSEIALEVGYNNPSYFARCFQMRFGCTPSRFAV
jgi:AraC-like DNA-binding protein